MAMSAPKALIVSTCSSERRSGLLIGASARELLCVMGNVPIVFHVLMLVRRAGITDAVLAVDPAVRRRGDPLHGGGTPVGHACLLRGVRQGHTTSAVLAAEGLLDGSPFLVHPGDAPRRRPFVEQFLRSRILGRARDRRCRVEAGAAGASLPHSTSAGNAHSALTRVAVFSDSVLDCLRGLPAAVGCDLAEPVERLRERGKWWRSANQIGGGAITAMRESLLDGNRLVLDELEAGDVPDGVVGSEIDGRVATAVSSLLGRPRAGGVGAGAESSSSTPAPTPRSAIASSSRWRRSADSILLPAGSSAT